MKDKIYELFAQERFSVKSEEGDSLSVKINDDWWVIHVEVVDHDVEDSLSWFLSRPRSREEGLAETLISMFILSTLDESQQIRVGDRKIIYTSNGQDIRIWWDYEDKDKE